MSIETPRSVLLRFGIFEADLFAGELRKQGLRIKLQEQPFLVLRTLLGRPGEIVSREELRLQIWSSDTFEITCGNSYSSLWHITATGAKVSRAAELYFF
jgi:DNA-binding response OmpR family regulator